MAFKFWQQSVQVKCECEHEWFTLLRIAEIECQECKARYDISNQQIRRLEVSDVEV